MWEINKISKKALIDPNKNLGFRVLGICLGQLEIRIIRNFNRPIRSIVFFLLLLGVAFSHEADAGTIIKSPAYLGLTRGLVGCWNFDGSYTKAPDCSGNNNTGTLIGGPKKVSGKTGQALNFDGVDDQVSIGSDIIGTGAETISAWIKPDSLGAGSAGRIIDNGESSLYLSGSNTVSFTSAANGAGEMVDTGLAVRYYLDEASSGDPATIEDASGNNYDLTATGTNVSANMEYAEVSGNRGVDSSSVTGDQRLKKEISDTTDVIRDLNGGTQFTLETVLTVDATTAAFSRFFGTNDRAGGGGNMMLKTAGDTTTPFQMYLAFNDNDIALTGMLLSAGTRYVVHIVVDTAADTIVGYVDGVEVTSIAPTMAALSLSASSDLIAFNRESGGTFDRSFDGVLYYGALYAHKFTSTDVTTNYDILTLDDDTPAGSTAVSGTNAFSFNDWTHVVVTRTAAGSANIYVNGVLSGSANQASSTPAGGSTIRIGNNVVGTTAFDGLIDETRTYNRVLSATEVSRLYRIGLGSTANRGASASPLDKGLVGHWTFDGPDISGTRAKDRSGFLNHGTLTNGPIQKSGKIGQALQFDGSNDHVTMGTQFSWSSNQPKTVVLWFKTTTAEIVRFMISQGVVIGLSMDSSGHLESWLNDSAFDFGGKLNDGSWHSVVYVYDGSAELAYLDGVRLGSSNTETAPSSSAAMVIGRSAGAASYFNGLIDDVRIYNRPLSAGEISRLYNSTQSKLNSSGADFMTRGLVGCWNFDGSYTKVPDCSGNNKTGTITVATKKVGKIGQALEFNGTSGGVIIDKDVMGTGPITVSAWVYPRAGGNGETVFANGDSTETTLYSCSANGCFAFSNDAGVTEATTANNTFKLNVWQHITVTRNSSNQATIYINGIRSGSANQAAGTPTAGQDFSYIGRDLSGNNVFNGLIDDVRVYNREFSASEVLELYNTRK